MLATLKPRLSRDMGKLPQLSKPLVTISNKQPMENL